MARTQRRKLMIRVALVAALLLTTTTTVQAAGQISIHVANAGDLAELCGTALRDPAADAKINFCHGFAQGAIDVQRALQPDKKIFCMPTPAPTRTATMTEFVSWVRGLPAHRTLGPTDGFFQFLAERFPCK
jgi:Rap1a immunity proteins